MDVASVVVSVVALVVAICAVVYARRQTVEAQRANDSRDRERLSEDVTLSAKGHDAIHVSLRMKSMHPMTLRDVVLTVLPLADSMIGLEPQETAGLEHMEHVIPVGDLAPGATAGPWAIIDIRSPQADTVDILINARVDDRLWSWTTTLPFRRPPTATFI